MDDDVASTIRQALGGGGGGKGEGEGRGAGAGAGSGSDSETNSDDNDDDESASDDDEDGNQWLLHVAFTATDPIYGAELCSTTSYTTDTMVGPATSNIARRTSDIPGPVTSSTRDCNPPSLSQTASYDVARVYEG